VFDGRAALRRTGAQLGALLAVVVLIFGAVGFGTRTDKQDVLPGIVRNQASETYARDALGSIAPISETYVERRLGTVTVDRITRSNSGGGTSPTRSPAPVAAPPAEPTAIEGKPGAVPGLAPGGWILTLDMAPNAATVPAGGEIVYRIMIKNVGTDDFRGRSFLLEWHTPLGTVGRNSLTQCNLIPVDVVRELCESQRLSISPGAGDASHEQTNSAGLISIAQGETWVQEWHVQTLNAASGTQYTTHAHLTVNIDGQDVRISTPPVVVTVS
jgi:hypothetical protein